MDSNNVWMLVQELRGIKGTKAKKDLLAEYASSTVLQNTLFYTYNPFLQYGMPATRADGAMGLCRIFNDSTWDLLDKLASGELSGTAAKKAVADEKRALLYSSEQLFCAILSKSLDIGLAAKGINEVFPGLIPEHAIQLAKPIDWSKVTFPCYVSPKLDGLRAILRGGQFYSRKGHRLEGLSQLARQAYKVFGDRTLDGELMVPGVHFNEISGKIRSFKETPDAVYHVFDLPDSMSPFYMRYIVLSSLNRDNDPDSVYRNVCVVPHGLWYSREGIEQYYDMLRSQGHEGVIIKNAEGLYEGKRTWDWMKLKNTDTADCRVVGMFEGGGKYDGLVGGIYVDFNGVRVGVGSGLTDLQRREWMDEPELIMGKIVEVAYQEVTPDGSLRHPRLKQIRGDLS